MLSLNQTRVIDLRQFCITISISEMAKLSFACPQRNIIHANDFLLTNHGSNNEGTESHPMPLALLHKAQLACQYRCLGIWGAGRLLRDGLPNGSQL